MIRNLFTYEYIAVTETGLQVSGICPETQKSRRTLRCGSSCAFAAR